MSKPTQARLNRFFSVKSPENERQFEEKIQPCETPSSPTVTAAISISEQVYKAGKTKDLGMVLQLHSQLIDVDRYRMPTYDGPRNVVLLDTIRQGRRKFLKSCLEDDRFSSWLVYTQLSGGGVLCKLCLLMQARLKHGMRPCVDFKKFVEKALDHRDARYHRESTSAAKGFINSMETGQDVLASMCEGNAKQMRDNRMMLTSIVKTVVLRLK